MKEMMKIVICIAGILTSSFLIAQDWPDKTRALPQELRKVPVAIFITHNPNPNYAEIATKDDGGNHKYVWKHSTTVFSLEKELVVFQAGSFIWYNEEGWKKNVDYNRKKFAKRFSCPKGRLSPGEHYTFTENYRWGSQLYGGDALWYVLAKDEEGNVYKGIGLLETEGEVVSE